MMKTDRRTFIRTGALALAGTAFMGRSAFAAPKKKGIVGLQLYSIREEMTKDPLGSLKKLAEMDTCTSNMPTTSTGNSMGIHPQNSEKCLMISD